MLYGIGFILGEHRQKKLSFNKILGGPTFLGFLLLCLLSLLRGNKPALLGCLSQHGNLAKVEEHLIAICMLRLSSIGRKNLNA